MRLVNLCRCQQLSDGRGPSRTGKAAAEERSLWWHASRLAFVVVAEPSLLCRHCPWQCRLRNLHRPLPCGVPHLVRHGISGTIPWKANSVVCFGHHRIRLAVVPRAACYIIDSHTVPARTAMAAVLIRWSLAVFDAPVLDSTTWFYFNEVYCTWPLWSTVHCRSGPFQGWPQLSEAGWRSSLADNDPIHCCSAWVFPSITMLPSYS